MASATIVTMASATSWLDKRFEHKRFQRSLDFGQLPRIQLSDILAEPLPGGHAQSGRERVEQPLPPRQQKSLPPSPLQQPLPPPPQSPRPPPAQQNEWTSQQKQGQPVPQLSERRQPPPQKQTQLVPQVAPCDAATLQLAPSTTGPPAQRHQQPMSSPQPRSSADGRDYPRQTPPTATADRCTWELCIDA